MNVKNKIVALVMSFVICFGTVSNSFAYDKKHIESRLVGGVTISAPILAVVSTSALATGYAIKNIDDVYAIGTRFVEYCGSEFSDIVTTFENSVRITATGVVLVGSAFLTYLQSFFKHDSKSGLLGYWGALPVYGSHDMVTSTWDVPIIEDDVERKYVFNTNGGSNSDETYRLTVTCYSPGNSQYDYYTGQQVMYDLSNNHGLSNIPKFLDSLQFYAIAGPNYYDVYMKNGKSFFNNGAPIHMGTMAIKYQPALTGGIGAFDENALDNAKDKNGDLPLHVPQNLGDLPKADKDTVIGNGSNPPYTLPNDGFVTVPNSGVSSLPVDGSVSFPTVGDTPTDTPSDSIFSTVKDFIISLVVPSDTFWTDTFNSFRDNFIKNFPMLDMGKFDSLAVGGKPFPNLYAYGSKIVDGDVINSIVDWLRPIIAGFIMICLMLFNYRKIYKLIRNTEPFGGIAQGSSDFSTGLRDSEYRQTLREFRAYMAREGGGK